MLYEKSHNAGQHGFDVTIDDDIILLTIIRRSNNVGRDTLDHMQVIGKSMAENQLLAVFLIIDASAVDYHFADAIALVRTHRAAQQQGGATDVSIIPIMVHTDERSRKMLHVFKDALHQTNTRGQTEDAMPIFIMNTMNDALTYIKQLKDAHSKTE